MSQSHLFGLAEIAGDTYERSLMVPCPDCKGTGEVQPSDNFNRDLTMAALVMFGARTSTPLVGSKCPVCSGTKKIRDENAATKAAAAAIKRFYPALAKQLEDGWDGHTSDCATHNEPAYPARSCDCR